MRREILNDLAVARRSPEEEEVFAFLQKNPLTVFPIRLPPCIDPPM